MEYEQLMRDLSDSLERENDLKEQLKYAEEETRIMRKKLSDMDDENESLNLQLQKLSAAKSGKYFKKDLMEKGVVTEREHELKLQMELAEQELKVLHRKMEEMDNENETLFVELKMCRAQLMEKGGVASENHEDKRTYDERIKDMAGDIDKLKWRLIEQDQEATGRGRKGKLQKSRSLDESGESGAAAVAALSGGGSIGSRLQQAGIEHHVDARRQLETTQHAVEALKEKLKTLEEENGKLSTENQQLGVLLNRRVPSVTADDAALQNIELKDKVKHLQKENSVLRDKIKALDQRTSQLAKAVTGSRLTGDATSAESRDVREQLRTVEEEFKSLRKKMAELETQNTKLIRELEKYKASGDDKSKKEQKDLDKLSMDELRDRVDDLEAEISKYIYFVTCPIFLESLHYNSKPSTVCL